MPVPIVFRTADQYIKTYNFVDTITGKGVAVLYLSTTGQSTGTEYAMLGYTTDSDTESTIGAGGIVGAFAKQNDFDFDLTAEQAFWVAGEAVFSFTQYATDAGNGPPQAAQYLIIKIRKYDGTTETDIATVQSDTVTCAAGMTVYGREQCQVTVPKTFIAAGDVFRITVEQWYEGDHAASSSTFWHDPSNRNPVDAASKNATFICYIPVLIRE